MEHNPETTLNHIETFHRYAKEELEYYNKSSYSREYKRIFLRLALNYEKEAMVAEESLVYEIDTGH